MNNPNVIQVENLSKIYKLYNNPVDRLKESIHPFGKNYHQDFHAVHAISFTIKKGEMVGIIGKNGSGKSTLLKMLTGVLTPTTGSIRIDGRISALLELGAGFNPEFTGMENIYFHGTVMGYTREAMAQKVDAILEFADIGEFIQQPVKTYSSGMFARLAFAVAINVDPDILIVDEALSVGDLRFQQKAIRKMQELMEKSKAIFFVSHDMRSIRNFCSRVLWLADGKLFKDGNPKELARMFEDYMIHDILPASENNSDIVPTISELPTTVPTHFSASNLVWEDIVGSTSLGGTVAQFQKISVCLPAGKSVHELEGNEQIILFAKLNVYTMLKNPLFGFGVFNDKGVPIVHFNSETIPCTLQPLLADNEVCVKYQLQLPNLRNGTYFISVGLDDGQLGDNIVVHRVNDCYSFKVNRHDCFSKQHGNIIVQDASIDIA
jgi:ABC-type polysaccharide/polyol phosphate transport system ATPase subunit